MRWGLKMAIRESGMSQLEICNELEKQNINMSEVRLSRIVTGVTVNVPEDTQNAISEILGISVSKLFGGG